MKIRKYKKKPVVIEAVKFISNNEPENNNMDEIVEWINAGRTYRIAVHNKTNITILTLEGTMEATVGDYIIRGIFGEFYPCKPDIFNKSYELIAESEAGNG